MPSNASINHSYNDKPNSKEPIYKMCYSNLNKCLIKHYGNNDIKCIKFYYKCRSEECNK